MNRLLVLCLVCAPSSAFAVDNSALTCGSETATYYPRGDHWPAVPPLNNNPVVYRQQQDGAPGVPGVASLDAVNRAFNSWMEVTCGGASTYPNVLIVDGMALTPALPDWETRDRGDVYACPDGSECSSANCDTAECNLMSAENVVYFVTDDWEGLTGADAMTVALTTNLYIPDTGFTITSDMEFNAVNFDFRVDGVGGCTAGSSSCFDVESVALHEAGHFLGFNHVMCTDAVMFPQGNGTLVRTDLSSHETTGLCTVYPPRPTSGVSDRYSGEQCTQTSQCPSDHICIKPVGMTTADFWGWCAKSCTTTSDCGTAFICAQQDNGTQKFCRPGPNNTGGATGGTTDPTTGNSLDLCAPCNAGSQCSSGVCINDGTSTEGICTQTCVGGSLPDSTTSGSGCPDALTCTATDQGWSVCWPDDVEACAATYLRGGLNDVCYLDQGTTDDTSDDWFQACGPDLVCFGFKSRSEGQGGACVSYCNNGDRPCPDESGLTCCFGVDDLGNCTPATASTPVGGCFDLRRPGESCVLPEQSICAEGSSCFHFGDPTAAKCYRTCQQSETECNAAAETCMTFTDEAGSLQFSLCCDNTALKDDLCVPSADITYYELGVRCDDSTQCDSGLCQGFDGDKACSRPCNAVTGVGCPGDIDVNGDGVKDGGFRCILISGEGRCWPARDPVNPAGFTSDTDASSGCCNATGLKPQDALLTVLLVLPFIYRRRRQAQLTRG